MGIYEEVLEANRRYQAGFNKPMKLGVRRKLTVITCMDSRLIPEQFLGLDIGDAEIIRNGGGRVTMDVLRSLVICLDLLDCKDIMVIHHTDCGGQAVVRHHDELVGKVHDKMNHASLPVRMIHNTGWYLSYLVPQPIRQKVMDAAVHPIHDLKQSVIEDVKALRRAPTVGRDVNLYGLIYSTETGGLEEVVKDMGTGLYPAGGVQQKVQATGGVSEGVSERGKQVPQGQGFVQSQTAAGERGPADNLVAG